MAFPQNKLLLRQNSKTITQSRHNNNNNIDSIEFIPDSSTKSLLTENIGRKLNFFSSLNKDLKAIIIKKKSENIIENNKIHKKQIINNDKQIPCLSNYSNEINNSGSSIYLVNQAEIGLREYSYKDKFLSRICKGPPELFRWISWIIASKVQNRNEEFYYYLLSNKIDRNAEIQIKKDINRTILNDKLFSNDTTKSTLYNVLKVYSIVDKEVSYCQGMNFIVAFLLIISDFNEVETFYMMVNVFSSNNPENLGIRGFFINNFPLLNLYVYQFNGIFNEYLPNLKKHFEKLEIPNELWISKWFQTLFTICMPIDVLVRIWDCIFVKGLDFIFNFSITLLKSFEHELLKYDDISDIADYFKNINPYFHQEKAIKVNIESLITEALHLKIKIKLLKDLKKEYELKFNVDLSVLQTNDFNAIYDNFINNYNKNNSGIDENYGQEEEKISHLKEETKSKFHNAIVKTDDINHFKDNINIDYISDHEEEWDNISDSFSEFDENNNVLSKKIKAHTLYVQHGVKCINLNYPQFQQTEL